jgi:hypothetical protein
MTAATLRLHLHSVAWYLDGSCAMAASESDESVQTAPAGQLAEGAALLPEEKPSAVPAAARCMTVAMNNFSLQFQDPQTEHEYHLANSRRQKQRWLRALVASGFFQIIFFVSDVIDSVERPNPRLAPRLTAPVRLVILAMQLSLAVLLWLNLIPASQPWILGGSLAYAVPTLLIFALQKEQMQQWDVRLVAGCA